jgi:uncharacterized protein YegJ (DUF2314 family)
MLLKKKFFSKKSASSRNLKHFFLMDWFVKILIISILTNQPTHYSNFRFGKKRCNGRTDWADLAD